jgi:ribosomal protein S17E
MNVKESTAQIAATPNEALSNWYAANSKKINRLTPEKKKSVENAVVFFLKRYSQAEPLTTQIKEDDFSFLENFDPEIALVSEIEDFDLENLEL